MILKQKMGKYNINNKKNDKNILNSNANCDSAKN